MLKGIKDALLETGLIEELCVHLQQIGLQARVVDSKSPDAIHHSPVMGIFGTPPLGGVKVDGRNIDMIEVYRIMSGGGGPRMPRPQPVRYFYNYVVKANVEGLEKDLEAEIKPIEKGLFKKELVDFGWKGGKLAESLNEDSDLKKMLSELGVPNIVIGSNKKDRYVEISLGPHKWSTTTVVINGIPTKYQLTLGRRAFPSREAFETYDRIAQHIRRIIGTSVS